jgi:hypothetical protein
MRSLQYMVSHATCKSKQAKRLRVLKFRVSWNNVRLPAHHVCIRLGVTPRYLCICCLSPQSQSYLTFLFHGLRLRPKPLYPPMGNCVSSLASFTPTPSYLATANGRPMSVNFHTPQPISTSLSSRSDIFPSKPSHPRRGRGTRAHPTGRDTALSPRTGGGNLHRARSQDYPHHETTARAPTSSRSNVPTCPPQSPPPPGLSAPPHHYRSRGGNSSGSGPAKSRSFEAPSRDRSPHPPPHRMASTSSLDGRRPPGPNVEPVLSQDDLTTPWSNQKAPSNGSDDRLCLEPTLQSVLREDSR